MQQPYYTPVVSVYAGFWRRFVAYLVDGILIAIPFGIVSGIVAGAQLAANPNGLNGDTSALGAFVGIRLFLDLAAFAAGWLYFTLMESSSYQATVGKMAMGVVVTDLDGRRISFGRATGRYFGKIISALICYVGFIMAGFTQRKQALHDMMASTLVVRKGAFQTAPAYAPAPPAYQAPPPANQPPPGNYPPPPPPPGQS